MDKDRLKKIAYLFGKILGVIGLLFVFYKLSQEYTYAHFIKQVRTIAPILPALFLLNLLSMTTGIYAWRMMLIQYAQKQIPYSLAYYFFSKTEISKYLPGNIFHFVGRQALASKLGLAQKQMAKISLLHSFLLLVATIISSTLFAIPVSGVSFYVLFAMILASIAIVLLSFYLYPSFPVKTKVIMGTILSFSIIMQGIMLSLIVTLHHEPFTPMLFAELVSIYIISWLIGFATPGASGGLGVREGAFIAIAAFMHLNVPQGEIVFAVLLVRLINILVDAGMFLSTFLMKRTRATLQF